MYILGLSGLLIDGAACLLRDGQVVAAVEEERPVRFKQASMKLSGGLPTKAIELCFQQAGISWDQVDRVAYFVKPWREFVRMSAFRWAKAFWVPHVASHCPGFRRARVYRPACKTTSPKSSNVERGSARPVGACRNGTSLRWPSRRRTPANSRH